MNVGGMIEAARKWRGLAKLLVVAVDQQGNLSEPLAVALGDPRRRWQRVAAQLGSVELAGARGLDEAGELVGSWEAPDEDEQEDEPPAPGPVGAESQEQAQHRQHTQWVLREVSKIHEATSRLAIEMVGAAAELIRAFKSSVGTSPAVVQEASDEGTKTLGMLLSAVMQNQAQQPNNHNEEGDSEKIRHEGRADGDTARQGQPSEPDPVGA